MLLPSTKDVAGEFYKKHLDGNGKTAFKRSCRLKGFQNRSEADEE